MCSIQEPLKDYSTSARLFQDDDDEYRPQPHHGFGNNAQDYGLDLGQGAAPLRGGNSKLSS